MCPPKISQINNALYAPQTWTLKVRSEKIQQIGTIPYTSLSLIFSRHLQDFSFDHIFPHRFIKIKQVAIVFRQQLLAIKEYHHLYEQQ